MNAQATAASPPQGRNARQLDYAVYERSSPSLLSQQPVSLKSLFDSPSPNWSELHSHLESRLGMLRTWRWSWWVHWSRLAEVILPFRYRWLAVANKMDRGKPLNDAIVDSTATKAMTICAAGMLSGLMSPSRPWFRLGIALASVEPDDEARKWLDDVESRIYTILAGSNFYSCMAQAFQDLVTFGTAPLLIYEDYENVIGCYVPACGEYYLDADARQNIDTFYREFTWNVSQIVGFFGLKNCPGQVRSLWQEGGASLENEFIIGHAIEPNFPLSDKSGGSYRVVPKHFVWRELYWLKGVKTNAELSRRGFPEKPFMCALWAKTGNDSYGRCPAMDALGDISQLQMETRRKGEWIEKIIRPPMIAPPELESKPSSILPGHVTYVSTMQGQGFKPAFELNPMGIQPLIEDLKEIQGRINKAFFVDTFLMISQMEGIQPRNELEIAQRAGEKIEQLGPVIENVEDFASDAIHRVWSIMDRRSLFPPMPASLRRLPLKIEYISMMKIAQRAATTASMERMLGVIGKAGEAAVAANLPSPARVVDLDEWVREYAELVQAPARIIRSREDVARLDQQQAAKLQDQQMWQKGQAGVQALEGLSRTQVGGGQNAISAMLGTPPPNESP